MNKMCAVCGKVVEKVASYTIDFGDKKKTYHYCSEDCVRRSLHSGIVKRMLIEELRKEAPDDPKRT